MVKAMNYGRLGNSHFQNAAAIAYALKHGLEFTIPSSTNDKFWNPIYLQHLVNPNWNQNLGGLTIKEPHFHYATIPFYENYRHKNIVLDGYWQSYHYFDEYREQIIELFAYPWELIKDTCSVHARFGDYLTIAGKHILMNEEYLRGAMKIITEKTGITKFKVFSDDIGYFSKHFGHVYDFDYTNNANIVDDLVDMSCCHSHINSSSTFSWWSAYLNRNPNKVVVTPKSWFTPGWDNDTKDLVPPEWIKL